MRMEPEQITLESCHSIWFFDTGRTRFRRVLKGATVGGQPVATAWRPYTRLEADPNSETFTVFLNASGSRIIRSWRHAANCAQCADHMTGQMSLDTLRATINN